LRTFAFLETYDTADELLHQLDAANSVISVLTAGNMTRVATELRYSYYTHTEFNQQF